MDSDNNMAVLPDLGPPGVTRLLWVVMVHGEQVRTGAGLRGNVNFGLSWNESMRMCCNSTLFGFLWVLRFDGAMPSDGRFMAAFHSTFRHALANIYKQFPLGESLMSF